MDQWLPELQKLGYKDPLFIPSAFSQAIIASFNSPAFHKAIIDHDFLAMSKNLPSILLTASCNDWILLLQFIHSDPNECMNRLQALLGAVQAMENLDHQDMIEYNKNLPIMFNKLEEAIAGSSMILAHPSPPPVSANPLISAAFLSDEDKAKLCGFSSCVIKKNSKFANSPSARTDPALVVPLLPRRQLELDVALCNHILWVPTYLNYPAPFSIEALSLLFNSDPLNTASCFQDALKCHDYLPTNVDFNLKFFSLNSIDPSKCSNPEVFFRTKAPNPQDSGNDKYLRNAWNAFRPYIKCRCYYLGNRSCKAGIMWVDQLIWFMVHHLEFFFPMSSMPASLIACITWLSGLPSEVIDAILCYYSFHSLMLDRAKSLTIPTFSSSILPHNSKAFILISQMFSPAASLSLPSTPATKRGRILDANLGTPTSSTRRVRGTRFTTSDLADVQKKSSMVVLMCRLQMTRLCSMVRFELFILLQMV